VQRGAANHLSSWYWRTRKGDPVIGSVASSQRAVGVKMGLPRTALSAPELGQQRGCDAVEGRRTIEDNEQEASDRSV